MIKVILLMDYSSEHDRKLLRGMMRYSKENGPWLFYRPSPAFRFGENMEEWAVKWAKEWHADAIIGRWDEGKLHMLDNLDIPVVLQNNTKRSDVFSNLTGDYEATGKLAAQYFRKRLFTDYAFFGRKDIVWSEERSRGFESEVLAEGGSFYEFLISDSGYDRSELEIWLKNLPKPIAMFCCDDSHALMITEICKMINVSVPEDIAVLGVDDDELLCDISDPSISSIRMDVENGGYLTCQLLNERISKRDTRTFNVSVKPLTINERGSTRIHNVSDKYVLEIVNYIDEHYFEDVSMETLLGLVPLSRRSIEMRFKKAMGGGTIYQYLLSVRVARMAELLITTERLFSDIVYEVGFRDIANVTRIFRRYKGCTPSEYRKRYCAK